MAGFAQYSTVTPKFRAAFVNLFEPKKKESPEEKDKYGMTMLFGDGEDLSEIKALATQLMTEKFGDKKSWPKGFHKPWRDQADKDKENENADGKTYDGFVSGNLYMNGTSERKPEVVDENVKPILNRADVYSGCYMVAHITLFWFEKKTNKGIGVSINTVQKVGNGEPLGGSPPSAASVFKPTKLNNKKAATAVMDDEDEQEEDEDPMA